MTRKLSTLVIFKARLGWYWRFVASNGRVLAIGGEPFATPTTAERSFLRVGDRLFHVDVRGCYRGSSAR